MHQDHFVANICHRQTKRYYVIFRYVDYSSNYADENNNGACRPTSNAGATTLAPCHVEKSLQLI